MINGHKNSSLGIIPNDWEVNHLGEICDVRDGTHDSPKYHATGIPFITSKNLTETKLSFEDIKFISKEDHINFSKRSHVENGDILFGMIGTVGKPIVVNEEFEFSIKNVALLKFGNSKELNNFYALNVLKSSIIDNQFKKMSNGGVLNFVALGNIRNLIFPLPPLPEQQKIAEILSTVDDKIEVIDQQIIQTQELKKGLMQRLLSKGIGHTKFKDSPLGMIPESWEVVELGSLLKNIKGGGTPSKDVAEYWSREIPWATVKDLKKTIINDSIDYISQSGLKNSAANLIPAWTLIISTRMAVGKAVFFTKDVSINQDLKALFPKNNLNKFFLLHWFFANSEYILNLASGSTVKGIRLEVLKALKIILPKIEEQQKIAEILTSADDKLEVLIEKKGHYQELKQGLMQQLLTGKIRVKV